MEESSSNNGSPQVGMISVPQKKRESSELDVRSAEVQEIIGRPPHWLVRMGTVGFFVVLALVLVAATVIKYPETIKAPLRLTAINAPKAVIVNRTGKLVQLIAENGNYVEKGQILAWLESTANHASIIELSAKIDSLHSWMLSRKYSKIKSIQFSNFSDLGELQSAFQVFVQHYLEFIAYLPNGFFYQKRVLLKQEMAYKNRLLEILKERKQLQIRIYDLAEINFSKQKKLAEKNFVAAMEFIKQKRKFLSGRLPLKQVKSALINLHLSQVAGKKQLMQLNKQIEERKFAFLQSLNTFKSAIEDWKKKFLLIAPIRGKLIYSGIIQEKQTLQVGQQVFFIKPQNTRFFGEMIISQRSFGRIQEGQKVLVRFAGYPVQEYGTVTGKVVYLSEIPVQDSSFVAKVSFPNGLKTNYGRNLPPVNGMRGTAEIITQDMRLIERFYNNIAEQL